MALPIYLLETKAEYGYDTANAFVVAAPGHRVARTLAASQAGDEGPGVWASQNRSSCRRIGRASPDIEAGVVLRSFNAG